ncbi:MAG: hypothetical protein K6C10_01765 [Prevotella sp.]|nr:hypothetical protein [Prevotella sp.]
MIKKLLKVSLLVLFAAVVASCGNKHKGELNRMLLDAADKDEIIDAGEWEKIAEFLDGQKANFKDFYKDGDLDIDKVKDYIEDFFENRRPPKNVKVLAGQKELNVNFYLERSGSMVPYDAAGGTGEFKKAITQMLNNLPGSNESNKIYVVNSEINAYPKGFSQFISDSNIFEATKGIGDASSTDFSAIFTQLLDKTGANELSILVTDMIYSTKQMAGVNPQKVFAEAQGMINAVFKSQVEEKGLLIVKMQGSYNGAYYPYNSQGGVQYNGRRPYYIIVVGSNDNIARLTRDDNYLPFSRFSQLTGYEDMCLFETNDVYKPYYSLLLESDQIRGRFRPVHGQGDQIKNIENVEVDRNSGDLRLLLAVDLGGMLIDEQYLTNPDNYVVESDDDIEIKEIRPIDQKDVTPAEKKHLGKATHIFVLESEGIKHAQDVDIKLMNRLPQWVEASSSDDDTNVSASGFANTTFGLKYLLQGIYDSYRKHSKGEPYYFELDMEFGK